MFLKSLTITRGDGSVIRDIRFCSGLNLIVDETPTNSSKATGNNVGKTSVLKLIDFCLGADAKGIYVDPENQRHEYKYVKDFLIGQRVLISLTLKEDLSQNESREVCIERNFLGRINKIQSIDGIKKTDSEFKEALTDLLFPGHYGCKPTFRQIISHNIRYSDLSINNTLKTLDRFTRDDEYETLYLFLLGCDFNQGDVKQELRIQIGIEEKFKKRLESEQTKSAYETALNILESDIKKLESRKSVLNLNSNFEADFEAFNNIKYLLNLKSAEISKLEIRKNLILEAQREMKSNIATIDIKQLEQIYQQATLLTSGIQKTFNELCEFHNKMVASKIHFIEQDLPKIATDLADRKAELTQLLTEENRFKNAITQSDSFGVLEQLIADLNAKYQKKGEYENILQQLKTSEDKLTELNNQLSGIDDELFSDEYTNKIKRQVNKFNQYFSSVSNELYDEKYALKVDIKVNNGRRLYAFTAFNTNFSSGKKQGEISCFDIAYTLFADEENIPCMHFLLNDKKELMHDNQLLEIAKLVNNRKIQFVISILKDKLPVELNRDEYVVLRLSQHAKLFRIEG